MHKEIEARFLDIDKQELIAKLQQLEAIDNGDDLLSEVIFYDAAGEWQSSNKYVRVRTRLGKTTVTYKHIAADTVDGAKELEFTMPDAKFAIEFLENIGLVAARHQEKNRHTFTLDGVTIDIDTWPNIPTYVEIEGPSQEAVQETAAKLGLDWNVAVFIDARKIIEQIYNTPVGSMKWFTFDRVE